MTEMAKMRTEKVSKSLERYWSITPLFNQRVRVINICYLSKTLLLTTNTNFAYFLVYALSYLLWLLLYCIVMYSERRSKT